MDANRKTIYRCNTCSRKLARKEDLQSHLHWHHISDGNFAKHYTEEILELDSADVAAPRSGNATASTVARVNPATAIAVGSGLLAMLIIGYALWS